MNIKNWLKLDIMFQNNYDLLQKELLKIPYIKKHTHGEIVSIHTLDVVLNRLRDKDLAISFIMSNKNGYEMILIGVGKWKIEDNRGRKYLYRDIGKCYCDTIYECMAKAVLCLYLFLKEHKKE